MSISYHRGDELPPFVATLTSNGQRTDFSEDWTFTLTLKRGSTVTTKTTGMSGTVDGSIVITWSPGDLNIDEGVWTLQLTARGPGNAEETIEDELTIEPRTLAEV